MPKDIIVSTPEELERKQNSVGSVLRYAQQEGVTLYISSRLIRSGRSLVAI